MKNCPFCESGSARGAAYWVAYHCGTEIYLGAEGDSEVLSRSDSCLAMASSSLTDHIVDATKMVTKSDKDKLIECEAYIKLLEKAGEDLLGGISCGCGMDGPCKWCHEREDNWEDAKNSRPKYLA